MPYGKNRPIQARLQTVDHHQGQAGLCVRKRLESLANTGQGVRSGGGNLPLFLIRALASSAAVVGGQGGHLWQFVELQVRGWIPALVKEWYLGGAALIPQGPGLLVRIERTDAGAGIGTADNPVYQSRRRPKQETARNERPAPSAQIPGLVYRAKHRLD